MLSEFLLWLDALPARYWAFVYVLTALAGLSAFVAYFRPQTIARWNRPWVFAALLVAALFAFRWPTLFDNRQDNNPDESQIIAGAIVLKSDPIFWKSVDGTTHGPLVQLPLAGLAALGVRLDFTNARILSLLLIWTMLICTWLTLRVVFGDGLARVLILPAALFEISTQFWDFNQYSSEHVPIALLGIATWLVVAETLGKSSPGLWRLGLAGIILGALPFAKLQSAPMGVWIGLVGIAFVLCDSKSTWALRRRRALWLIGGALVVPIIFFFVLLVNGIWSDFWISYIETNLLYAGTFPMDWSHAPQFFLSLIGGTENFGAYFTPLIGILIVATAVRIFMRTTGNFRFTLLTFGLLVASAYATIAPHRMFTHYLQFTIAPLALAVGAVIGTLHQYWQDAPRSKAGYVRFIAPALVLLFVGVSTTQWFSSFRYREPHRVGRYTATRGKLARSPVAQILLNTTRPDDFVGMWGWEPRYFVEANRRHATREAHTALELYGSSRRDYYRSRYLSDLIRSKPAVFADVVGPGAFGFGDRPTQGHESFPELGKYIADHYRLIAETGAARIYLRNDREF